MSEVLVIGGGMAGAIAALAARREGAKVILARCSYGATALSSGAIDVAPDVTAPGGDLAAHLIPIEKAARDLARMRPAHPYAVLKDRLGRLMETLSFAASALSDVLAPFGGKNLLLPTPIGTVKPCATALHSQVEANLRTLPDAVAFVELSLRPEYDGALIAGGLEAAAFAVGKTLRVLRARADWLTHLDDPLRPPYEIAGLLDSPSEVEKLALAIRRGLPQGAGAVLLPPLLGRADPKAAAALGERLGMPCHELLSAAPSVPGVRLQEALDRALSRAGVDVTLVDLEHLGFAGGPFALEKGAVVNPGAVVLATGKYIGGGIRRERRFFEPCFGIPVFAGRKPVSDEFIGDFIGEGALDEHLAFRAGIRIDPQLRPLGLNDRPVHPRLFAAGAVLAGYDPALDKSGLGVAIFTGCLAGENAARAALALPTEDDEGAVGR